MLASERDDRRRKRSLYVVGEVDVDIVNLHVDGYGDRALHLRAESGGDGDDAHQPAGVQRRLSLIHGHVLKGKGVMRAEERLDKALRFGSAVAVDQSHWGVGAGEPKQADHHEKAHGGQSRQGHEYAITIQMRQLERCTRLEHARPAHDFPASAVNERKTSARSGERVRKPSKEQIPRISCTTSSGLTWTVR